MVEGLVSSRPVFTATAREIERLHRLTEVLPLSWKRHADDLGVVAARLQRLGAHSLAARALHLKCAALAAWKAEGCPEPEERYCAACGAPLRVDVEAPRRRAARKDWRLCRSATCRKRWERGAYCSELEAVARWSGLSIGDFWVTPPQLIETLSAEFGPCLLDAASTQRHAKAPAWITIEEDAFKVEWIEKAPAHVGGVGFWFLNPPYGRARGLLPWIQRAREQAVKHLATVIVLAPPGIGSTYRTWAEKHALQIRNLPRRLAFLDPITGQPVRSNTLGSSLYIFSAVAVRSAGYAQQVIAF